MKQRPIRPSAVLAALAVAAISACSEDATSPQPESATEAEVAGTYEASTFAGYAGDHTIDVLASGGSLSITLNADGSTEGTMFVPGGDEDGSDYTADLAGSWSVAGSTITFDHPADTFIRDVDWDYYDDGTIRTDNAFTRVVLTP